MNLHLIQIGESVHDALVEYNKLRSKWLPNLEGGCAVGAYFLAMEATKRGIDCQMCAKTNHAFTKSDGVIYDPTASQFSNHGMPDDFPKVGVYTEEDLRRLEITNRYRTDVDSTEASLQLVSVWPSTQNPRLYRMQWINSHMAVLHYGELS